MGRGLLRSSLAWSLVVLAFVVLAAIAWFSFSHKPVSNKPTATRGFRVTPVVFGALPGWSEDDPRGGLEAFRRSCAEIVNRPPVQAMGWAGYAGTVAQWRPVCTALPHSTVSTADARKYFETWFAPIAVDHPAHFTGYYEPMLSGNPTRSQRYHVPVYGRPSDLVTADLGEFRHTLEGEQIVGKIEGTKLVPYLSRADIDADGLPAASVLLYADDPVSVFFLQIQGSGLVRYGDGKIVRLAYAGKNGRPYTAIGRVLIRQGALDRKNVSLQTIRAWLDAHPKTAQSVLEADQSYVFFETAPLGDASLGSPGTEGVPLAAEASLAIDSRLHPLGAPVYIATAIPDIDPTKPDHDFRKLLIAQDTGGTIKGAARGDIFFGAGTTAEAIAGRLNAHGQFFVLVPKAAAAALGTSKTFADAPQ